MLGEDHPGYQPLYPKAGWRKNLRSKEKALKRGNWYKGGQKDGSMKGVAGKGGRVGKPFLKAGKPKKDKKAATVVFVPSTRGSILIQSLKDDEQRMSEITGFKIKFQEAGGTPLTNAFDKNLGRGLHCGRTICPPCDSSAPEKRENCKSKNVVYESKCRICNPDTQPAGRQSEVAQPAGRDGIYLGETSRILHERALEHVKEGESFSYKSHIVKHWINTHPELPSPPEMIFSITGRYRNCLSRQVGEALRIHYSQDNILNSKSEYRSNTITRLAIEEDAWERRERSRLEEEEDRLAKETVDQFRRDKTTGRSNPTSQTLEYETDEEEFASEEDCHQLMKYEPEPSILPEGSRLDTTLAVPALLVEDHIPISTRPSNAQQVTLGQIKRSPGDPVMNISGVSQVQHEHPWLKVVREGEDESGVVVPGYETDEDEFDGGEEPSILPEGSRQYTTLAVPATAPARVRGAGKRKRSKCHRQCQNKSGYPNSSL
jgi:hypothetical protein